MHRPALSRRLGLVLAAAALVTAAAPAVASAAPKPTSLTTQWSGNGATFTKDGATLNTSRCGTKDGAPVEGAYLLFVLSSTKSLSSPTIRFGTAAPVAMVKSSSGMKGTSSYKYVYVPGTASIDLAALKAAPVAAAWTGDAGPTFTVSHGCLGDTSAPKLTVVLLGDQVYDWTNSVWTWGALGASYNLTNMTASVCETAAPTNCVNFAPLATPGTSGSITMSAAGPLTISGANGCAYLLFDYAATAPDVWAGIGTPPIAYDFGGPGTTSGNYDNGQTLYVAHVQGC